MNIEKSNYEEHFTEKNGIDAVCIIPAAGFSSRMGSWKGELKTREGLSLLEHSVLTAQRGCRKVVVVGGYEISKLTALLSSIPDLTIIFNPNFESGMLGSVQAGLEDVFEDFFIYPMDMPLIRPDFFSRIVSVSCSQEIIRPVFNGIQGHPVFFRKSFRTNILKMDGESIGVNLVKDDIHFIPWEDDSVIFDLDSKDKYYEYLVNV